MSTALTTGSVATRTVTKRPRRTWVAPAAVVLVSEGSRFRYGAGPGSDYLVVTITPTRRGVVHLEGVKLDHRRGAGHLYQHGTQTIRVDRTIPT